MPRAIISYQFVKAVNDIVGTSLLQFLFCPVAVGHTAGLCACVFAHQDVHVHITNHKRLACLEAQSGKRIQNRFRIWFCFHHVICIVVTIFRRVSPSVPSKSNMISLIL